MLSLLLRYRRDGRKSPAARSKPNPSPSRPGLRDYQRAKLYRWERDQVFVRFPDEFSLAECRGVVAAAYIWWERPKPGNRNWLPPEVTDGRGRRHACGSRAVIKLPRWARTLPIVLHECAHGMSEDKHGPHFVRAYVELLVKFTGFERDDLNRSLAKARLDMAPRL